LVDQVLFLDRAARGGIEHLLLELGMHIDLGERLLDQCLTGLRVFLRVHLPEVLEGLLHLLVIGLQHRDDLVLRARSAAAAVASTGTAACGHGASCVGCDSASREACSAIPMPLETVLHAHRDPASAAETLALRCNFCPSPRPPWRALSVRFDRTASVVGAPGDRGRREASRRRSCCGKSDKLRALLIVFCAT